MEGDSEQLRTEFLSEWQERMDGLSADDETMSRLFPELPEGYFEDNPDCVLEKPKPEIPSVRPYFRKKDLNNDTWSSEDNRPKDAWELGLSFDF